MVLKLDRLMPINDLHKNMKILKIDDIHKCNTLGLVNEMVSDRCPAIFRNYFEIKENSYDLRTHDQLTIPLTRLTLGQHAVSVKGASLWNKLDKSLLNYRLKKTLNIVMFLRLCWKWTYYYYYYFITYIFLFYSSVGLVGNFAGLPVCTVPSAIVHCNQNEAGHQTIKAPSMPCWGAAGPSKHSLASMPQTGEIDR